jgi:hypothetical protein
MQEEGSLPSERSGEGGAKRRSAHLAHSLSESDVIPASRKKKTTCSCRFDSIFTRGFIDYQETR